MESTVEHPFFIRQRLVVRSAGFFKGPMVLVDGVETKLVKRKGEIENDEGKLVAIELKGTFLDPIPVIVLDGQTIRLAKPLEWYEYAWMCLPILLMFMGGALGGFIGGFAAMSSSRIFRSERSTVVKYVVTGLVSVAAFLVYLLLAGFVQGLIHPAAK